MFGASSSQDYPSIFYPEWEVNVGRSLLKTKSDSALKNTEFNSRILESYLLDSLWRDLQQYAKVETLAVQNTQKSSVPLNPPRPMAAKFSPLCFLALLHDLPQNFPK